MNITTTNEPISVETTTTTAELSTTTEHTGEDVDATVTFSFDMYMFEIMGAVLGVVVLIVLTIICAFVVKSHRRRQHNRRVYINNQRQEAHDSREHYNTCLTQENDQFRVQSAHQPTYGQPTLAIEGEDIHGSMINGISSATNNSEYMNRDVTLNSGIRYDVPRPTIGDKSPKSPKVLNLREQKNPLSSAIMMQQSQSLGRRVEEKIVIERKQSLRKYSQETFDINEINGRQGDNSVARGSSSDYENSPKKLKELKLQQGKTLKNVPPAKNKQMASGANQTFAGTSKSSNNVKKNVLVKQSSEYEDPDKILSMRNTITERKRNDDQSHEYSNLIMPDLVVKRERFPDESQGDYENENEIDNLRRLAPPLPVKRAHTSNVYDRPNRPIVRVRNRTFSEFQAEEADDMYIPMDGSLIEEDKYIAMDLESSLPELSENKTENKSEAKVNVTKPKVKPVVLPKPKKGLTQTQKNKPNNTLSVKPPPCSKRLMSHSGYVNYDEDSRYMNLFKSKSNDDIYVYADSKLDYRQ